MSFKRTTVIFSVIAAGTAFFHWPWAASISAATITRGQILTQIERCADVEIKMLPNHPHIGWVHGVFYIGLIDLYRASKDRRYLNIVLKIGNQVHWRLKTGHKGPVSELMGNAFCFGQAITGAYAIQPNVVRLEPLEAQADQVVRYVKTADEKHGKLAWWWCDSLFMAPATFAHLSVLTHNPTYVDFMNQQWLLATHMLYDKKEHLFFRDHHFLNMTATNGKPVFWSRGEGWVLAGTARVLKFLPAGFPDRSEYVTQFGHMAAKIASLQGPDGIWRPSMLDFQQFPMPESSGTALDCYAIAWGINHHLLNKTKYLPVAVKAWAGLLAMLNTQGNLAHVQSPANRPRTVTSNETEPYASGAFIMAGVQLMNLAPFNLPSIPKLANTQ